MPNENENINNQNQGPNTGSNSRSSIEDELADLESGNSSKNEDENIRIPTEEELLAMTDEPPQIFGLNRNNIGYFKRGYQIFLGTIILLVLVNVITPVWLRRDKTYTVQKTGCYGLNINDICLGVTKFSREVRKDAIFGDAPAPLPTTEVENSETGSNN